MEEKRRDSQQTCPVPSIYRTSTVNLVSSNQVVATVDIALQAVK